MVKCSICCTPFPWYKLFLNRDNQLLCIQCAERARCNHDQNEEHRRDMERKQAERERMESEGAIKQAIAVEETRQKEIQLQIARVNSESERKIAEAKAKEKEEERRLMETRAKLAQHMLDSFSNMNPKQQQLFAEVFNENPSKDCKDLRDKREVRSTIRKKAPWTALHCTLKT